MEKNKSRARAVEIITHLRSKGFIAYLCGGCVRDLLLEREPKDYDIVTNARPDEIQKIFKKTVPVGAKFGVVKVIYNGENFEVATFRKDGSYQDGRRPEAVFFSDEKEDALRRDFTVNGLFFDPVKQTIIDHVDGQRDIRQRIIKTIGKPEERFSEDHLRLMRAIRFACQLNFKIERATWNAVSRMAHLIETVSRERIRDELVTMLLCNNPAKALFLLHESRIMKWVFPDFFTSHDEMKRLATVLTMLDLAAPIACFELAFGVLWSGRSVKDEQGMRSTCKKLHLSNKSTDRIVDILSGQSVLENIRTLSLAGVKRFVRKPCFGDALELYRLSCLTTPKKLDVYVEWKKIAQRFSPDDLHPKPLITGNDLIHMGFEPGVIYQEILTFIEEMQLEGKVVERDLALRLVTTKFAKRTSD